MADELLSYSEVEELLESILVNKRLTEVGSLRGINFILFSHPTTEEIIFGRHIRKKALYQARQEGLPSKQDLETFIENKKILTGADQIKIKELQEKIAGQRRLLQITRIEGRRKPVEESIIRFQNEIDEVKSKVSRLFYMSAETKADEEAVLYLSWVSTYNLDGKKYWPSFEDFEGEVDLHFRANLIDAFNTFNHGLPTKTIRYLARHGLWRIRYAAALRVSGSLFCRSLYDLTPDQLALIYWTDYYQSIYEMMPDDRPDDSTIQDDDALDAYMEDLSKRREEERNEGRIKRRGGNNRKGKLSAWDRGEEVIITASHPEYMNMAYSDKRVGAPEGTTDVEVISPNSRRAKNQRSIARRERR